LSDATLQRLLKDFLHLAETFRADAILLLVEFDPLSGKLASLRFEFALPAP